MITINRSIALFAALGALTLSASPVASQGTRQAASAKQDTASQMMKEAKISRADAQKTALAQVPHGTIKSYELEREEGHLLYSFDIATKGKSGIDEVRVDAITGVLVGGVVHEDAKIEGAEAKSEMKEKRAEKKAEMEKQ